MELTDGQKIEFKDMLQKFQCEKNRLIEESFARTFAESEKTRLFFINEDCAYTDGTNIIVDPAFYDIYKDKKCLKMTESVLNWESAFSENPWNALKMVTRGLTLHECLHILYTDFPSAALKDKTFDSKNKLKTILNISNIIEDAYIEAVGASVYDNIEVYLKFNRIAPVFAEKVVSSTAGEKFKVSEPEQLKDYEKPKEIQNLSVVEQKLLEEFLRFQKIKEKAQILIDYFDYMSCFLLLPFMLQKEPRSEIAEYVEKTKQLFLDGSVAENGDERYVFCNRIYEIIKELIPEDDECKLFDNLLPSQFTGQQSHSGNPGNIQGNHKGRSQKVTTRLFSNLDGSKKEYKKSNNEKEFVLQLVDDFDKDKCQVYEIVDLKPVRIVQKGSSLSNNAIHKDIIVNENHPRINLNLKKAYQNIYEHYKININSYNSKFLQILKIHEPVQETRFQFGTGIDSKKIGDVKKRFWYKKQMEISVPDLSVLLLIDGSASMNGERRNAAMNAAVILHEVLKSQNIQHAIVEHRALSFMPEIDVNVLVSFNCKNEEKYNIMQLSADDNTRDGLAILWAERYINQKTSSEKKLILVLSDGYPIHEYDDYTPPVSSKDTANSVKKIISRGTTVIAVALDNNSEDPTYEFLKEIYPSLIKCDKLEKLTGQLLTVISKQLQG